MAPSMPSHDLLTRRSLSATTVFTTVAQPTPRAPISNVGLIASMPYFGVGPLILQPSPSRPVHAEDNTVASQQTSSTRLAFLAILAIPLVSGFVVFILMRRRGKQKPARRAASFPVTLRSETARARLDVESPRMLQLPRDRIRAMNSVPRDNEGSLSPPAVYHIFSPRLPSPPPNEYPRPLGNYFASLSVPGPSEPSSPLTNSTTFTTNLTSCPSTPCTPTFAISSVPASHAETVSGGDETGHEETRFTWDFRCQGVANRLSCCSIGAVLDISHANSITTPADNPILDCEGMLMVSIQDPDDDSTEDAVEDKDKERISRADPGTSIDVQMPTPLEDIDNGPLSTPLDIVSRVENISPSALHDKSETAGLDPLATNGDSTLVKTTASIVPNSPPFGVETFGPESPNKTDRHFSAILTVLDLKLDDTSFSSQIIKALAKSPDYMLIRPSNVEKAQNSDDGDQQASTAKHTKKRLLLSKPNHRHLAPRSPSLKVHYPNVDAMIIAGFDLQPKACSQTGMGRRRASSDTKVDVLRKAYLLDDLVARTTYAEGSFDTPNTVSGQAKVDTVAWAESVLFRSSLSMPLTVELASREAKSNSICLL